MLCNIDWPGVFYAVGSVIGAAFGAMYGIITGALSDLWSWIKEQFFAGFDQFVTGEGNPEELVVQLITGLLNGIWSVIKGIGTGYTKTSSSRLGTESQTPSTCIAQAVWPKAGAEISCSAC